MTWKFLLSFDWLNLAFLSSKKKDEVVEKCELVTTKICENF